MSNCVVFPDPENIWNSGFTVMNANEGRKNVSHQFLNLFSIDAAYVLSSSISNLGIKLRLHKRFTPAFSTLHCVFRRMHWLASQLQPTNQCKLIFSHCSAFLSAWLVDWSTPKIKSWKRMQKQRLLTQLYAFLYIIRLLFLLFNNAVADIFVFSFSSQMLPNTLRSLQCYGYQNCE